MNKIEVLLINLVPSQRKKPLDGIFTAEINYGLLSIATELHENNINTKIIDQQLHSEGNFDNFVIDIIKQSDVKLIGLSCISGFAYPELKLICGRIKSYSKEVTIVVGGKDHVGKLRKRVLKDIITVDILVKGEGEWAIVEIWNYLKNKITLDGIPDICFRDRHGNIVETPPTGSSLEPLLRPLNYSLYENHTTFPPSIELSRGCQYSCAFCSNIPKKVRKKSIIRIVEEMEMLATVYRNENLKIYFEALTLTFTERELLELGKVFKEENLKHTWRSQVRVEYLNGQKLEKLYKAGARVLDVGFESGSEKMLRNMGKTENAKEYLRTMSEALFAAKEIGITLKLNILFFLGETKETMKETWSFLMDNMSTLEALSAYPLYCFPGTKIAGYTEEQLEKCGASLVKSDPWVEKRVYPINLSKSVSFKESQEVGIHFGQAFQSIDKFVEQKKYGYICENTDLKKFYLQLQGLEKNKRPFHIDEKEKRDAINYVEKYLHS